MEKNTTPLSLAAHWMPIIYDRIVLLGCAHERGASCFEEICDKKITTCSTTISAVLQKAGVVKENTIVGHTDALWVSNEELFMKKDCMEKAIWGYENLDLTRCRIVHVNRIYSELPDELKRPGIAYIQDSNACMCAGGNWIYSCNNSKRDQVRDGRYYQNKVDSGYPFHSPILFAIVPNDYESTQRGTVHESVE